MSVIEQDIKIGDEVLVDFIAGTEKYKGMVIDRIIRESTGGVEEVEIKRGPNGRVSSFRVNDPRYFGKLEITRLAP